LLTPVSRIQSNFHSPGSQGLFTVSDEKLGDMRGADELLLFKE